MPKYRIHQADVLGTPALPGYEYADPQLASNVAKQLSRERGEKLMIKAVVDNQWRFREQNRFNIGEYRQLPWAGSRWWNDMLPIWKDHFPHPALEKPGWLAYTASPEDGARDKQTIVRPGAYLKRFFEREMSSYGVSERKLVEQFMLAYGPLEIKFAETEADIIKAYVNGPETCMKLRHWPHDGRNPAWVYANGDLAVAYIGELDGRVTARTLVWPEKKLHSRVYGDIARLQTGLERMGYKWGAPVGAKIKRVQLRECKFVPGKNFPTGCFLTPYIDKRNMQGGGHLGVIDKGDHLEICMDNTPGSHHCGLPDGLSGVYVPRKDEHPTFTCENCETEGHPNLTTVLDSADPDEASEYQWCRNCVREYTFQCRHSGTYFNRSEVDYTDVMGSIWATYYAEMYAVRCEMTGNLFPKDYIKDVVLPDGQTKKVGPYWAEENGVFQSWISKKWYTRPDRVRMYADGFGSARYIGKPEIKYHTFQCDGCKSLYALALRNQDGDKLRCLTCDEKHASAERKAEKEAAAKEAKEKQEAFLRKRSLKSDYTFGAATTNYLRIR